MVFRREELVSYLGGNPRSAEYFLRYHVDHRNLTKITGELYRAPAIPKVPPCLIAGRMTRDAVVSHHSALRFWTGNREVRPSFYYTAKFPKKRFVYEGTEFIGIRAPKHLQLPLFTEFGIDERKAERTTFRITNRERTLVDALDRPEELSSGWKATWVMLERIKVIEFDLILDYLRLLGNSTTAAKVGHYLDEHRNQYQLTETQINELVELSPKHPCYANRSKRCGETFLKRWNLIIE